MRLRFGHFIRISNGETPSGAAGVLAVGGPWALWDAIWRTSGEAGSMASPSLWAWVTIKSRSVPSTFREREAAVGGS